MGSIGLGRWLKSIKNNDHYEASKKGRRYENACFEELTRCCEGDYRISIVIGTIQSGYGDLQEAPEAFEIPQIAISLK